MATKKKEEKKPAARRKERPNADNRTRKKQELLEALRESLGIVTMACENVGVGRSTFYEWLRDDPEFKAEVDDINNRALDFVESKLFGNIENGDVASIIFYLKTKGKARGYIEKQEVEAQVDAKIKRFHLHIKPDED